MLPSREVRVAFRALMRAPSFTLITVITLALGVGVTSTIFSIANGVLIRGLPWGDPERIVTIDVLKHGSDDRPRGVTPAQRLEWSSARAFQDLVAVRQQLALLSDGDEPRSVIAPRVSANALSAMRIRPLIGRSFTDSDAAPGAHAVVILSERVWTERYDSDAGILGRTIKLDGRPATVVGVMASGRWFPWPDVDLLQPLEAPTRSPSRTDNRLLMFGRLRSGADPRQAQAELVALMHDAANQYPDTDAGLTPRVQLTLEGVGSQSSRRRIVLLMAAAAFVLLIVCTNLTNLLLARAASQQREIATRAALGASRWQLVRELLAECAARGVMALP
jgi:putative ABC transport system permease protein